MKRDESLWGNTFILIVMSDTHECDAHGFSWVLQTEQWIDQIILYSCADSFFPGLSASYRSCSEGQSCWMAINSSGDTVYIQFSCLSIGSVWFLSDVCDWSDHHHILARVLRVHIRSCHLYTYIHWASKRHHQSTCKPSGRLSCSGTCDCTFGIAHLGAHLQPQ